MKSIIATLLILTLSGCAHQQVSSLGGGSSSGSSWGGLGLISNF
ncbi:hypothetical protein [Piscirickettsia litoralis]|nr:hypothetical protein [Piscirickettsia litoralis]